MQGSCDEEMLISANSYSKSLDIFEFLRPFKPERSTIADVAKDRLTLGSDEHRRAILALGILCFQGDQCVLYRPGESPVGGRCPVTACGRLMREYVKQ